MIEEQSTEDTEDPPTFLVFSVIVFLVACIVLAGVWIADMAIKRTKGYDLVWDWVAPDACELRLDTRGYYRLSTNSDSTLWAIRFGGGPDSYNQGFLASGYWWDISDYRSDEHAIVVTDSCKAKGIYKMYLKQEHKDFNNK